MPAPDLDFRFYVAGIEDGMLEALRTPMSTAGIVVRSFGPYSGQLNDEKSVKAALAGQTLQFPFVMTSYGGGASVSDPKTSPVLGRPRHERHDCQFSVVVGDDNPQGQNERRGKAYEMISVVWDTLVGVRLIKQVDDELYQLNTVEFREPDVIPILLPDKTVYGIVFETAFRWVSPDRTVAGTAVTDVIVGASSLNASGVTQRATLPGVTFIES